MKRGNYLSYEFFEVIEHDCALALFLNKVFNSIHLARLISAPKIFNEADYLKSKKKKKAYEDSKYQMFYQTCLFELYAHSLIRKLEDWQKVIREYPNEYNGSWEYYARYKRLHSIDMYGGNESDYNEDGTIKTDVDNECLVLYSVIGDMVQNNWTDIVLQTKPEHLSKIYASIQVDGSFSLREMFKAMGKGYLKSYRMENGAMVENSEDDEILHKASSPYKSESVSSLLMVIVSIINRIVNEIDTLEKQHDNKQYFEALDHRIDNILSLNIEDEIYRKYIQDKQED